MSSYAYSDLKKIYNVAEDAILTTIKAFKENDLDLVIKIESLREFSEVQKEKYKNSHIQRLKEGKCNVETGVNFLELLTICEKIIDHCANISLATSNYMTGENFVTKQELRKNIYETQIETVKEKLNECNTKYVI